MSDWAKFYVDAVQPGIVRGGPFDSMGGMLVGLHAKEVCNRLNTYGELKATIERVRGEMESMKENAQLVGDAALVQMLDIFCAGIEAALDQK